MADLKLGKLPDRTPIKLTINVLPDLYGRLQSYATAYEQIYGQQEPVADLIPAMLHAFLQADKVFTQWCRDATDRNR